MVGRTALYRDFTVERPARAEVQLEADALVLIMPDGLARWHPLDGAQATISDGCVATRAPGGRVQRRFVRMLILERDGARWFVITPPDQGAVAPNVVRVPVAPSDAAVVDARAWEALTEWVIGGGRLSACSVADLARLACIATFQFAALIGEVAAQHALELAWAAGGPLRGGADVESALQPLFDAARTNARASEALVSALAHAAGVRRRHLR
jgi:hypothetical protein